jgi:hypothetical protein
MMLTVWPLLTVRIIQNGGQNAEFQNVYFKGVRSYLLIISQSGMKYVAVMLVTLVHTAVAGPVVHHR